MIYKKSPSDIEKMRRAGRVVAGVFSLLKELLRPGVTTGELDRRAEEYILSQGATPSFKGYQGFPGSICTSPNEVIVHGIPGPRRLKEGDIISLDVGAKVEGFHADSAWTFPVGEVSSKAKHLMEATLAALKAGLEECRPGRRLGDVGWAIEKVAVDAGLGIVREYVGHGVGRELHEEPQIPNYGPPGRRLLLTPGMAIAVEPMLNLGTEETKVLPDGWGVVTADGAWSAHFEHTVAIVDGGHEVLTAWEGD